MSHLIYHRGAPCTPPVVNGVQFKPSEEYPDLFAGEAHDSTSFLGIPGFSMDPESLLPNETTDTGEAPQSEQSESTETILALQNRVSELETLVEQAKADYRDMRDAWDAATERVKELEAIIEAGKGEEDGEDESDPDKDGTEDPQPGKVETLKAKIAEIEAKKAAGTATKSDHMKLGKLIKKLEAATK